MLCGEVLDGDRAAEVGLAWRCISDEELLSTAIALAERAASRDGELVRRTKASLDASVEAGNPVDALDIELVAQEWSMARPEFHATLERLRPKT